MSDRPIVAIGEVLVEIMARKPGDGFREPLDLAGPYPSGAPAIFINQVGLFGHPAAMIASVGADDFGRLNIDRLWANGVDTSAISVHEDAVTGSAFVRYRDDGSRAFLFNIAQSASGRLAITEPARCVLDRTRHLHVMGSSLFSDAAIAAVLDAVRHVKAAGGTLSFDPNVRPEIAAAGSLGDALKAIFAETDIYLPSGGEVFLFAPGTDTIETACRQMLAEKPMEIVVKNGANGALLFTRDRTDGVDGISVLEVDPTGAGDSFGGAYVAARMMGETPEKALRFANAAGACAVTKQGPMEGAASRGGLEALLEELELT